MSVKLHRLAWLQPAIATGSAIPFIVLLWRAISGRLGANPVETALNQLGLLTLILLLASLACTPLKTVFRWTWPVRIRRTLGLFAFFGALFHLLTYVVLDQSLALAELIADLLDRPFILIGFLAFCMLVPLALTSTKRAVQRMGFTQWKRLHRLAYVAAVLGVTHFYVRVKADTTEPVVYAVILGILFAVRIVDSTRSRSVKAARRRRASA